jgi:hypothetical protein
MELLLKQIGKTQNQFEKHGCVDLLLGKQPLNDSTNYHSLNMNWIHPDELRPADGKGDVIQIQSLLGLVTKLSFQHAQLSINAINLLTECHKERTKFKELV